MTDTGLLIHRYLDQELSLEERVQFIARLARDDAFRREVLDLEHLALAASRLPRAVVPPPFVAGVLDRVAPARPGFSAFSKGGRVAAWLLMPHTLRWNWASVSALACIALIALATIVAGRRMDPGQPGQTTADGRPAKVLVRLVVVQPDAETVQLAGDFNGWDASRTPLEPLPGGAWAATILLDPGRYEYMFVVNGREWIADPFAVERSDDGFGSQNAVLDVRPPMGAV
jgi:anti-sigma factor RsiW